MRTIATIAACLIAVGVALLATGVLRMPTVQEGETARCATCRNVILISVDSLRADHMSAYGYDRNTTPNFDAFAKQSAFFENYFSTSFLTPVSEMSVHTGRYPISTGVSNFDTRMPEDRTTLAQFFKENGYETHAITTSPEFRINEALKASFARGYDSYDSLNATTTEGITRDFQRDFPTQEKMDAALTVGTKPLFLWLALGGVHWPYGFNVKNVYADSSYNGIFKDKPLDWNTFQFFYKGLYYPDKQPVTEKDIAYIRDLYDNDVQAFDDFLGTLLADLKAKGMLENTIIIIQSEHGEDLGEHGYIAHYDVLDTQTHVPLLIYVPNSSGVRVPDLVSSVDVFPTIAELLHLSAPTGVEGVSRVPLIEGTVTASSTDAVFLERSPLWEEAIKGVRADLESRGIKVVSGMYRDVAIRTERFKYIWRLSRERMNLISWWAHLTGTPANTPEAELYDLQNDPGETKNVIAQFPKEAATLRARLEAWYAAEKANAPANIDHAEQLQPYF